MTLEKMARLVSQGHVTSISKWVISWYNAFYIAEQANKYCVYAVITGTYDFADYQEKESVTVTRVR